MGKHCSMQKSVKVFIFVLFITLIFFLQSCTYAFNNQADLTIVSIGSNGQPFPIMINTDATSKYFFPKKDGFIHANVTYKLPLISLSGTNIHENITEFSTVSFILDSPPISVNTQFYLKDGTVSLTGTIPATNNIYYIDYLGKGFLKNGKISIDITKGIYTIFFPQYSKIFLIENGEIKDFYFPYKWSIKLYMDDGDNPDTSSFSFSNLEPYLLEDLSEIKHNYYYPTYSSILAYVDLIGPDHYTYKFMRNSLFKIGSNLTDDSYSWQNLRNFINIKTNSQFKALFLWDHGDSWAYHNNPTKALFVDGPDIMNLTDLASALSGNDFDLLAFDMCLMGSVEVLYQIKDYAHYIVFSEGPIPSNGFDYQNLLCGNYDPRDFAIYLCDRYNSFYNEKYILTAVDSSNASDFFMKLDDLSDVLTNLASSDQNFVDYVQGFISDLDKVDLYYAYQVDLLQLLVKIYSYSGASSDLRDKILTLETSLDNLCISGNKNIGIAFIKSNGRFDFLNYEHNSFAKSRHWINFLKILSERITK